MINVCIDVFETEPGRLARMLQQDWEDTENWEEDELKAILRHQLAAPLAVDLATHRSALCLVGKPEAERITFGQLLRDRDAPLELLKGVKDFAKSHLRPHNGNLPYEVAKVLYLGSVLAARLRWEARISSLSDADLRSGLDWAVRQRWLNRWLRDLFRKGQRVLEG